MWPSRDSKHTGVFVKNLSEALERAGITVDNRAVIRGKSAGLAGKMRRHVELGARILIDSGSAADCLYVHAPTWFSPLVELVRRAGHKKLVVHTHGGEAYPHSKVEHATKQLVGWLLRGADLVVAPSRYYADEIATAFGVPERRLFISPSGGVDTTLFRPVPFARDALGIPASAVVLGFVGRIVDDKGWDVFLEVVHRLRAGGVDAWALVVGDGEDAEKLEAEARRLELLRVLVRPGVIPQAELPAIYTAMDVFLFPTRRGAEALGLVPIEAMACGVPVVGSNGYAVPEYVVEGRTGFLAPERDAAAFTAGVRRILDLPDVERAALCARAVEAAAAYDTERVTQALVARLTDLL